MTDPITITVDPGTQTTAEIVFVQGDLVAVKLLQLPNQPIVPVQVGAVIPLAGYEHIWAKTITDACIPGHRVHLTWIGPSADGMMRASIVTQGITSLDHQALSEGWAVPMVDAMTVREVASDYRMAVQQGAQLGHGGYADLAIANALRQETAAIVGLQQQRLKPTYFAANPGICFLILLIMVGAVAYYMRLENQTVRDANRVQGGSALRKGLRWAVDLHMRFVRPPGPKKDDHHA